MRLLAATLWTLAAQTATLHAQPTLNFKRIVCNWPTIDVFFSVECNGVLVSEIGRQSLRLLENVLEIQDFDCQCPDTSRHCPFSVSLVFDASGSMVGAGNAGAKAAGHTFVDLMDGMTDAAAVVWFSSVVTVQQTMTREKDLLHAAVDSLPAFGGSTPLWDAMYMGLLAVVHYEANPCRAVIVLTDGGDNASSLTPAEIISLANRNHVRVFPVGLGSPANATVMRNIAEMTGGVYYEVSNPAQLPAIYEGISSLISDGFRECRLTYEARCMDGGTRDVALTVVGVCNGSDTKRKTYKAPRDTSTFSSLALRLGKAETRGGGEATVPLELVDETASGILHPATFSLQFDRANLQFMRIEVPRGSLLEHVRITYSSLPGAVTIQTANATVLDGYTAPASMAELSFRASDPDGNDTVRCPVRFTGWTFTAGCFRPVFIHGEVCIVPRMPELSCELDAPTERAWNRSLKDYEGNPFPVAMKIRNTGDKEARNARFRIDWWTKSGGWNDTADLALVSPVDPAQSGVPQTVGPSDSAEAVWVVRVNRRLIGDSIRICVTSAFDNHDSVTCCREVWVPAADPVLYCEVSVPLIRFDSTKQQYVPMPFDASVMVRNEGGKNTDTVFARIVIPPELRLYGPDAQNRSTKKVIPAMLAPMQCGGVSWVLWHPVTTTTNEYTVGVWVKTANGDSSYCEAKVFIPWVDGPVLSPRCTTPDSLRFDETWDSYEPNPFTVRLTCMNIGPTPARNVTASLYLPTDVELADTLDHLRKPFPGPLYTWKPGDTVPVVTWDLRYIKKKPCTALLDVKFVVGGTDSTGKPIDSAETVCRILVPGRSPAVTARGPTSFCEGDSVTLVADEGFDEYLWSNGDTTRATVVRTAGSYTVTVRLAGGCSGTSRPVHVTVHPAPKPAVTARGPTSFCEGDSVTLVADEGYDEYLWSNGDTTRATVVRTAGSYTVTVRLAGGCSGTSRPVHVTVHPAPKPVVTPHGPTEICAGDSLLLEADAGFVSYLWSNNATTPSIRVTSTGVYVVRVVDTNGCAGVSDPLTVTVHARPPKPLVVRTGDVLSTNSASAYQWYLDGAEIPGATGRTHRALQAGTYRVRVTNEHGCAEFSDPYPLTVLGVEGAAHALPFSLEVHPNPAGDAVTVTIHGAGSGRVELRLFNTLGRMVRGTTVTGDTPAVPHTLPLHDLPPGMYFLRADRKDASASSVFLKR